MEKHIVTIPLATDMDPATILEFALVFGQELARYGGEPVVQDEDETSVADAE